MSITIDLPEPVLERYRRTAAERGVTLEEAVGEDLANRLHESACHPEGHVRAAEGEADEAPARPVEATIEEWVAGFEAFAEGAAEWGRKHLPPGHHVDYSRDSIYP